MLSINKLSQWDYYLVRAADKFISNYQTMLQDHAIRKELRIEKVLQRNWDSKHMTPNVENERKVCMTKELALPTA